MKSKMFKKRAIIIVSVRKEHTHPSPLVWLSRTAAAGTKTTRGSDSGSVPSNPWFHLRSPPSQARTAPSCTHPDSQPSGGQLQLHLGRLTQRP